MQFIIKSFFRQKTHLLKAFDAIDVVIRINSFLNYNYIIGIRMVSVNCFDVMFTYLPVDVKIIRSDYIVNAERNLQNLISLSC